MQSQADPVVMKYALGVPCVGGIVVQRLHHVTLKVWQQQDGGARITSVAVTGRRGICRDVLAD